MLKQKRVTFFQLTLIFYSILSINYQHLWAGIDEEEVTYLYQNGDIYVGQMKKGLKDGFGTISLQNNVSYTGTWKNDFMEEGDLTNIETGDVIHVDYRSQSPSFYEGDYFGKHHPITGMREGKALMIFPNKDRFIGNFKEGRLDGEGIYYFHDGFRYESEWENGIEITQKRKMVIGRDEISDFIEK